MNNYSSLNDVGETKSRKSSWGKHIAGMGKWKIQTKFQ
jgi:hypothetical protein